MNSAPAQSQYQVRFEWGIAGARTVAAGADVVVLVDVLDADEQLARSQRSLAVAELSALGARVVAGSLRNRTAVAQWVTLQQDAKGDRLTVAVIAVGTAGEDGGIRFSVEDLLGAGAVIDALAAEGHDYSSPEAAAACAAFTGLRGAVGHLVSASTAGKERAARSGTDQVEFAVAIDASTDVAVLGE